MKQKPTMKSVLAGYQADKDQRTPRKIAELLNYCAVKAPRHFIPWPWVAKVVLFEATLPREDSLALQRVKSSMTGAKRILQERYGRSTSSRAGDGVRATVDATDQAGTSYADSQRRVEGAIKALEREDAILDLNDIRDDGLKARVRKSRKVVKQLTSPDILNQLRLAATNAKEAKDKDK